MQYIFIIPPFSNMSHPIRIGLNSILLGDELGQLKLIQLHPESDYDSGSRWHKIEKRNSLDRKSSNYDTEQSEIFVNNSRQGSTKTLDANCSRHHRHRIVRILDKCLQQEPAASRAITNIRPIENIYESHLDTTEKPNNLFLVANKVGQLFVCDTDAIRNRLEFCNDLLFGLASEDYDLDDALCASTPALSPIYYNMNNKTPVCGGQPINQTNVLVIYQNGDIQHVNIGQNVLQSSLKIKRKAIRLLGLGYNSDARAVHWRIDGATGICYVDSDAATAHLDENDPLTDMVLNSPTHKLSKKRIDRSQQNLYKNSPCIQSRKCNEQDRLVPTQVINMLTSHADQYKPNTRICKWSSITSLNLIYRKLALYDLVGFENFERAQNIPQYQVNSFKLNDSRLAVGGQRYTVRVYDVQTQKPIYNCRTGASKNPISCPFRGEHCTVGDIDWLGGNKTTKKSPNMLATCSGVDSIVNVYDIRSPKPVFYIDLTQQTENKWQPYENQPKGCMFTSICASGAPHSTAVPSQTLTLGSTNGQLHLIDLRFVAGSHRTLGRLSGFCGGSIREIRFVAESFETSKMVSCATDRFVRVHRIQTSFTSVVSEKLATKVFLGTKPTCIQPVCDEITQSYLATIGSRYGSESHVSTIGSGGWSLM